MIKVEEIAEKYKGYEVDEEKLKELLTPPKTVWDLKDGDKYWYNSANGNTDSTMWSDCLGDNCRRNHGNCFLTREKAEFEVERHKVETILLKHGKRDGGSQDKKYFIIYDFCDKRVAIYPSGEVCNQGTIYFKSYYLAQEAIKEAGEDNIKKYIFGVRK